MRTETLIRRGLPVLPVVLLAVLAVAFLPQAGTAQSFNLGIDDVGISIGNSRAGPDCASTGAMLMWSA